MAETKSSGSIEAIRDWLNASLYNKEEIDDFFIQNNQQGLIPYDLTISSEVQDQFIKLVGQTSGKIYRVCLASILEDDTKYVYHGLFWFSQDEDVKIFNTDNKELIEYSLNKRADEIKIPNNFIYYSEFITTGALNSTQYINLGFKPKAFYICQDLYFQHINRYIDIPNTTDYIGGSSQGINNTNGRNFDLSIDDTGINLKVYNQYWANKIVRVIAVKEVNQFISPIKNQTVHINCGFKPRNIIIHHNAYLIVDSYTPDLQYPYLVSSNQAKTTGSISQNGSIVDIDNTGFTFKTTTDNRANKTVTWFATPT